jgi:hypothetical protein
MLEMEAFLHEFIGKLTIKSGCREPVTKIGVTREFFHYLMSSLSKEPGVVSIASWSNGALNIRGVEFVVREKDGF